MIGHSVGEFVAACLAGVFSLEDALALVAARGQMMQDLPAGSMMAVRMSEQDLLPLLPDSVEIAAINGPTLCVVSGPTAALEIFQTTLEADDVVCRPLHTSHAFHSAMMEPAVAPFAELISQMTLNAPQIPILSTVSANWLTAAETTDPTYWAAHLRHTVRFADGIAKLMEDTSQVLLEVGPGQTLSTLSRQHEMAKQMTILASSPHVRQQVSAITHHLTTLGRLWQAGVAVAWEALYVAERRRRVHLPTYPFERKRFWHDDLVSDSPATVAANGTAQSANQVNLAQNGTSQAATLPTAAEPQQALMQQVVQQQLQLLQQQLLLWRNAQTGQADQT
jgi:acyl transferase domain-containing protein